MSSGCFELFGLPVRWEVDLAALEKAYREAQKAVHPDRVAQGDAKARLEAMQKTSAINEAYKILKDPMRRAEELLRRRGIVISDDAKMPQDFLHEILDLREALEEAKAAKDLDRVRTLAAKVSESRDAALTTLATGLDGGNGNAVALGDAFARLKYFVRFLEEVVAIETAEEG